MKSSLHLRAIAAALAVVLTATITAPALASSHTPPAGPFIARTGAVSSNNWTILPQLGTSSLNAISMASISDGWIVGDNGVSFRYNGIAWNPVATNVATTINLNSVSAVPGTSEAWAVGDQGTILHFANGSWTPQGVGLTTQQLDAVWMVSTTDGWAVGAGGTILRYQAGTWGPVQAGSFSNQFHDVQMLAANNGWAVGEQGTVIHYDGTSWQSVTSGVSTALYGVWLTSPADGWIVGDTPNNTTPSTILHWGSGSLTPANPPSPVNTRLWYNFMTSPAEGWATGNGGDIIHYVNGSWAFDTTPLTTFPLYGVWFPVSWEGWAVGGVPGSGAILHYKATAPHTLYLPFISR